MYEAEFKAIDADHDGYITGQEAKVPFEATGLVGPQLFKVWQLADMDLDHKLNLAEFCIAKVLIGACIGGAELPDRVPPALAAAALGQPLEPLPAMTLTQKAKFIQQYEQLGHSAAKHMDSKPQL